jgi:6-phosphogluconolactonase/glucosamine-6-phosphate isomerase/deaminase
MLLLEFTEFDSQLHSHHWIVVGSGEEGHFADLEQFEEGVEG